MYLDFAILCFDFCKQIGLERIFSNAADFSGMLQSNESLKVSAVVQKAYIEVNEVGVEAAAATGLLHEIVA